MRTATKEDMRYVFPTWSRVAYEALKSACFWSRQARVPLYSLFQPLFEAVMARLLKSATVLIAANPEDPDQICGCLVYEPSAVPVVHLVAVKSDFHGQGIARAMFAHAGLTLDRPAVYSIGIPPRVVQGQFRKTARLSAPKAWTHVPYGLMP